MSSLTGAQFALRAQTGSRQNSKNMLLMDPLKLWFIHTIVHKVTEEQYYSCPSKFPFNFIM